MNFNKLLLFLTFSLIYSFNLNSQVIDNKKLDSILNYVNSEFTLIQKLTIPKKEIKFQRVTDSLLKLDLKDSILSELYFKKGTVFRSGSIINYDLSENYLKKAIELNDRNYYAYMSLGILYFRIIDDDEKAISAINKSIKVNPNCVVCLLEKFAMDNALGNIKNKIEQLDNLVETIKKYGIDQDYDYKIDDYASITNLSFLIRAYYGDNDKKALDLANYVIKLENKFLSTYDRNKTILSSRSKRYFGDAYDRKSELILRGELFGYDESLDLDDFDNINFKTNKVKSEHLNLFLKTQDSAIINRNKVGGNPSEFHRLKMMYQFAGKRFSDYKKEKEKYDDLENYVYRKENYFNSLSASLNQYFSDDRWKSFYPFEKFNRRKDTLNLPLYFDLSLNVFDISQLTLEGDYKDKFFADYSYRVESDYEDLEYTKLSEYSDSLTFFNYSEFLFTEQLELKGDYNYVSRESFDNITKKFSKNFYVKSINPHVWKFSDFPFDKQSLNIKIISDVDTSFYRLRQSLGTETKIAETLSLEEGYKVDKINFREEFRSERYKEKFFPFETKRLPVYSVGVFEIIVSRKSIWVFLKLFLGAFLSYVLSCLVFLIPKSNFGSRIDLTIGAIFGSIGNKYFVESSTSMSQVMTKADMINNLVIFLVLVNVVLVIMQDNDKFDFGRFENSNFSLLFSVFTMLILTTLIIVV